MEKFKIAMMNHEDTVTTLLLDALHRASSQQIPDLLLSRLFNSGKIVLSQTSIDTLNLYLYQHFDFWITGYIETEVGSLFSQFDQITSFSGKNDQILQLFHGLQWHIVYETNCLHAMVSQCQRKIQSLCSSFDDDTDVSLFNQLRTWLETSLYQFLDRLYFPSMSEVNRESFLRNYQNLVQVSFEIFVRIRSKRLFDMITDYPDSRPFLLELKECTMFHNSYLTIIGKELRKILNKRLLHLGASTSQILEFYVSMIKSLRLIDSSDILLNYVAAPVRQYLKLRRDTIRCIISSLTESKDSELYDELKQGSSLAYGIVDEDDEDQGPGEKWVPSKRNKELTEDSRRNSASSGLDILATLVSIYGSTELFIVEYRNLLSEKMLSNFTYSTDTEVANLELLKIRFGEESLHNCEVMLKDIEDSKRTNTAVHSAIRSGKLKLPSNSAERTDEADLNVDFMIISDNYWPSLNSDHMIYHDSLKSLFSTFHDTYMILKKPRKLHFLENLGSCSLDLNFADGSCRSFDVSAIQANVISFFSTEETQKIAYSFNELYSRLELDEHELAAALKFWIAKGVLCDISGEINLQDQTFEVVENQSSHLTADHPHPFPQSVHSLHQSVDAQTSFDYEFNIETNLQSQDSIRQKTAAKLVEDYVKSLLKSHGKLSIDRLFTSLQYLLQAAIADNTKLTTKDFHFANQIMSLRQFLQNINEVDCLDGIYTLKNI